MKTTSFRAPDGIEWQVGIRSPGASNAAVIFQHPRGSALDRYAWYLSNGPEARSVVGQLDPDTVLQSLDAATIARLFRRSRPISTAQRPYNLQVNRAV